MWSIKATKWILLYTAGLLTFSLIAVAILRNYSLDVGSLLLKGGTATLPTAKGGPCSPQEHCPAGTISFSISSGAGNVVPPKICVQNQMLLGGVRNNAERGINVVVLNGRTPEVLKVQAVNTYSGDDQPLVELLQGLERGNIVLMATYDEPSSNLKDQARNLIEKLGSSSIKSLGHRDNWVFVGRKGVTVESLYEKHIKNDAEKNLYEGWPKMLQLHGCVPLYSDQPKM